ncbi:MAG: formate--tetrahydrofolate ligase [Christensenellaceae bacterium]|nr:formate--tetrahydrofolate ligase [Christensenellaceae bacterium]
MPMPTDIEIAQAATPQRIEAIAAKANIPEDALSPYGRYIAKVDPALIPGGERAKLILVTAINPTPAGEGKTTVSVGLADGMTKIGKKAMLALREPSLGPVFGMKGGATGGGYAQVLPMENINLHFTGDLHAITAANNLLAAMVDNHIQQGNKLGIDPRQVTWRRCLDVNDRQLRQIVSGLGGRLNGMPREDGFDITAASEVMAVFCLASDLKDLKARLARLQVARTFAGTPVTAGDLHAEGAMTALLRDALQPNLVQTIDGTPCLMHGGPFANIAHGCNSVIATKTAMRLADYVVTEAGFGADLGAEKFLDIKCRMSGLWPDAVVVVATVRALKSHGGCPKADLGAESVDYLEKGLPNLIRHIEHVRDVWQRPVIVAMNRFITDTEAEMAVLRAACEKAGAPVELCDGWAKGGDGVKELAQLVCETVDKQPKVTPSFTYPDDVSLKEKIEAVATRIYGAKDVSFNASVLKQLAKLEEEGWGHCPVCIAKTQYSFSDDPKKLGAPSGYTLTIRQVRLSAGAGFVVAFAGDIIAMPGLPKIPAAEGIDVDDEGKITGLF